MEASIACNAEGQLLLSTEPKVQEFLDSFLSFFKSLDSDFEKGTNSSLALRGSIGDFLKSWNSDLLIQKGFPARKFPSSHVHVDFQNEISAEHSAEKIQLTVEIFGDNRQAIAANLLKLELAGRNFEQLGKSLGIGITLSKDLKKKGWDGATASSEEYEFALFHTYSRFLRVPLMLISLDE